METCRGNQHRSETVNLLYLEERSGASSAHVLLLEEQLAQCRKIVESSLDQGYQYNGESCSLIVFSQADMM
ncbi:hypothetical protein AVEN_97024-1 [Araneus ventricosus]|uniref:Uncharacterized protein n=1 Tax=Araneus ventricosus TaxID=182803 RepID=A0A4Y2FES4_ARAVE|nr:hypothetical protein AVEN_97024-1 [Araneus ventricosus]